MCHPHAPNYHILELIVASNSSVIIACYCSTLYFGKSLSFSTGSQTLAFGHRRYGRPTLATAGLFTPDNVNDDDVPMTHTEC